MSILHPESDYISRKNIKGGSPKGTDKRPCPRILKWRFREYAINKIANGNESYFMHNANADARFVSRLFVDLIPELVQRYPEECEAYFSGRWEKAPKLAMERVHKMYYWNDKTGKGRGKSREHPDFWEGFVPW